jgi:hypothetical protein
MGRTPRLGVVTLLGLAAGCRMFNRGITESILERGACDQWQVRYGNRITYALTNDTLTDVEFEGSAIADDVVVRYQRGLGPQAQCIADRTADLLDKVRERTGIGISTRTTAYLIRFDQQPQDYDITLSVEPNEFPVPLFVRVGEESCDAIIAQNHSYPYLVVHELVETSLVARAGGQILPDLSWRGFATAWLTTPATSLTGSSRRRSRTSNGRPIARRCCTRTRSRRSRKSRASCSPGPNRLQRSGSEHTTTRRSACSC